MASVALSRCAGRGRARRQTAPWRCPGHSDFHPVGSKQEQDEDGQAQSHTQLGPGRTVRATRAHITLGPLTKTYLPFVTWQEPERLCWWAEC